LLCLDQVVAAQNDTTRLAKDSTSRILSLLNSLDFPALSLDQRQSFPHWLRPSGYSLRRVLSLLLPFCFPSDHKPTKRLVDKSRNEAFHVKSERFRSDTRSELRSEVKSAEKEEGILVDQSQAPRFHPLEISVRTLQEDPQLAKRILSEHHEMELKIQDYQNRIDVLNGSLSRWNNEVGYQVG